jgi:hypothetical protein
MAEPNIVPDLEVDENYERRIELFLWGALIKIS